MGSRLDLHDIFKSVTDNVYFQPPETTKILYPCILYERSDVNTTFADNRAYVRLNSYKVTVIDKDPDSEIPVKISKLPKCIFDRHYVTQNLNHDVYNLKY